MNKKLFIYIIVVFLHLIFLYYIYKKQNEIKNIISNNITIYDKSIKIDLKRIILTAKHRSQHVKDCDIKNNTFYQCVHINPKLISIGFLDEKYSINEVLKTFSKSQIGDFDELNYAFHFIIDKNGDIYQLFPINFFVRHSDGINHLAIGIGIISNHPTLKTKLALKKLLKYLIKQYHIFSILLKEDISKSKWYKFYNKNTNVLEQNYIKEHIFLWFTDKGTTPKTWKEALLWITKKTF